MSYLRFAVVMLAVVACSGDGASPEPRIPASVEIAAMPTGAATVGATAGTFSVLARDRQNRPLSGVVTAFGVTTGGGRVTPTIDTTDATGVASTQVTLGTIPGANQFSAIVTGLAPVRLDLTAVAGATHTLTLNARLLRIPHDADGVTLVATTRDAVANLTSEPVTWVARDPTLVSVTSPQGNTAVINVQRRPGETYVVATSGLGADSVRLAVQDVSSSPCQFVTAPRSLALGEVVPVDSTLLCVKANEPNSEFALVAHYNTALTFVSSRVTMSAFGVTAPVAPLASRGTARSMSSIDLQQDFESTLRAREARELATRVNGARAWQERQKRMMSASSPTAGMSASARLGDVISLNVNAREFCDSPELIAARVVAITNGTIVLADSANPVGGFTAEEYAGFAMTMDTLIEPVNRAAFGAPADIDNNGRVAILFTKAVNELTTRGSAGIILGFFYARDLLPRVSDSGRCDGSNAGEIFYLMAPDPEGRYSDVRSKSDVQRWTLATIAHEHQHLINASRRMYVTMATHVNEEIWLNEGLSHIAEELVFFRASGLSPRQNIDGSQLALGTTQRELFDQYLLGNFRRYRLYVTEPEGTSPFAGNAHLTTRGATWSFLRYLADRKGASDGDLWYKLVNANLVGTPNLDAALDGSGMTSTSALAEWAVSVLTDDSPAGTSGTAASNPAFQQATWNFPSVIPATGVSLSYPLTTRVLRDGQPTLVTLQAGGNAYLTFGVPQSSEALIQASGNALPTGLRLTLVRIR